MIRAIVFFLLVTNCYGGVKEDISPIIVGRAGYFAGTITGNSMKGYYNNGDTVIVKPIEFTKIKLGQVIVYTNRFGEIVVHRVEEKTDIGFKMRGAANKGCDTTILDEYNLIGVVYGVVHERGTFRELLACKEK